MVRGLRTTFLVVAALAAAEALAFQEIPKASATALGVTKGKPFSSGAVFISGKYIEPPYVVERWGTGIRINKKQVTGQVIDWDEFLKTQTGVKATKTETAPAPAPAPAPVVAETPDVDESSLDDLFDDDPKPKKKKAAFRRPVVAPKPRTVVTYSLDGDFVPNDASKALLKRINDQRTEIDKMLRTGKFICFGDNYSQVVGDNATFVKLLETLPKLQQRSSSAQAFHAGIRAAKLDYLNEVLCEELFRNRTDYRKLQDLGAKMKKDQEYKDMLEDVTTPLF